MTSIRLIDRRSIDQSEMDSVGKGEVLGGGMRGEEIGAGDSIRII